MLANNQPSVINVISSSIDPSECPQWQMVSMAAYLEAGDEYEDGDEHIDEEDTDYLLDEKEQKQENYVDEGKSLIVTRILPNTKLEKNPQIYNIFSWHTINKLYDDHKWGQ